MFASLVHVVGLRSKPLAIRLGPAPQAYIHKNDYFVIWRAGMGHPSEMKEGNVLLFRASGAGAAREEQRPRACR
jgi:hypothetical protein